MSNTSDLRHRLEKIKGFLSEGLKGKTRTIELSMTSFLAGGHLLLEGPPGTGKTSLARNLAQVFKGSFSRVQMTSDLLPSDIIGILRIKPDQSEFEFRRGPIFNNFLLADELNRTSAKTQSALLEAMAEGTVTVDGETYSLPDPFFVVATQNPQESQGVYPLAESQLDRFMMLLPFEFPEKQDEIAIYESAQAGAKTHSALPTSDVLVDPKDVATIKKEITKVKIESTLIEYCVDLIRATRFHSEVVHGASVRGGLQLTSAARALAYIRGREFVIPEDIRDLAVPVLAHRVVSLSQNLSSREDQLRIMREILDRVLPPR